MQNRLYRTWNLVKLPVLAIGIAAVITTLAVYFWRLEVAGQLAVKHENNRVQDVARELVEDVRPHTVGFFGVRAFGHKNNWTVFGMRQEGGGGWTRFNVQMRRAQGVWRLVQFREADIAGSGASLVPDLGDNDPSPYPEQLTPTP